MNLKSMIEEDAKGNQEESDKYFWILHEKEHEADIVRTELIEKVSTSEMFPEEKMDMIDLARAIDFIADSGHEAGRILSIIHLNEAPDEMKKIILDIGNADKACVESLTECFTAMRSKPKNCIELTQKVEAIEEQIDMLYAQSRVNFGKLKFVGWDIGPLHMLAEFVDSLEQVADWCENTSDIIKAIAVKIQ
jgi:predicted phosphate transport protein (TIGR00153 family)